MSTDRQTYSSCEYKQLERMLTLKEAQRAIGCGHSLLYKLIGEGSLDARKLGRHTRITESSVIAFQQCMPRAEVATGQQHAA